MTLVGFYFLLAFVFATIPAGIYAKVEYGTSLSNVDWLHGTAESLLTVTNLLIGTINLYLTDLQAEHPMCVCVVSMHAMLAVIGLRQGIAAEQEKQLATKDEASMDTEKDSIVTK